MCNQTKLLFVLLSLFSVQTMFARSAGPPVRRTGAAVDGGLACNVCHRSFALNPDTLGKVVIEAGQSYTPGVRQTIRVTVSHPQAQRWGFQLTARPVNDETKMAGTFTVSPAVRVMCDPDGTDAPCNGAVEFASHTSVSTLSGSNGTNTWDVEWTPPSEEVGDIVFYAAGNAANNDGTNNGDRIYTTSVRLPLSPNAACPVSTARPTIQGISNSGSGDRTIAPNTMVSVYGLNFNISNRKRSAGPGDFRNNAFPRELACVAVEVGGQRAPVSYVQNDQINVQIPGLTQTGSVDLRVIVNPGRDNELRSDVASIPLQATSPAFFTFGTTKSIAALNADNSYLANTSVVSNGRPAKPGDIVVLFGTGFGPTDPAVASGALTPDAARLRETPTVTIGSTTLAAADVLYAGLSPGSISGLYQINVRVPASAPDGDVPVTIRVGSASTQTGVTIPVRR